MNGEKKGQISLETYRSRNVWFGSTHVFLWWTFAVNTYVCEPEVNEFSGTEKY